MGGVWQPALFNILIWVLVPWCVQGSSCKRKAGSPVCYNSVEGQQSGSTLLRARSGWGLKRDALGAPGWLSG